MSKYDIKPKVGTRPKVVIYKRVSDKRQSDEGYSIEVQEDLLLKVAADHSWEVLRVFEDDGKSARTLDRKDMQEFLDFCDENSDVVDAALLQDTSRLCRNVQDHLTVKAFLKKRAIKMIPFDGIVDDSPEGDFIDLIIAGVNELESKRTGKKTKRIMDAMLEMGLKPGMAPVGYINSFKKGVPMHVDNEKRFYICEIFKLWNTGNYSMLSISEKMFEDGFRSKSGKKVGKSGIEAILKRVLYAGGLAYDGKINKNAQHEAIITMDEFNKAQDMLLIRNKGANRSRKHNTLLAGMIFCFKCGNQMYGEYHLKGNYYRCKVCGKPLASMEKVENSIKKFFTGARFTEKGLSNMKDVLLSVKQELGESVPQQRSSLISRREALDMKMKKLEDKMLFNDTSIDKDRLNAQYEPLKKELAQVDDQLKLLEKPSSNLKDSEIEKVVWGLGQLGRIYEVLPKSQKKQFLRYFITKVFVDCAEDKIVQYELVPEFEALVSGNLVRISSYWLPGLDSNQQP